MITIASDSYLRFFFLRILNVSILTSSKNSTYINYEGDLAEAFWKSIIGELLISFE